MGYLVEIIGLLGALDLGLDDSEERLVGALLGVEAMRGGNKRGERGLVGVSEVVGGSDNGGVVRSLPADSETGGQGSQRGGGSAKN